MKMKTTKEQIKEVLDDTFEGIHYKLTMATDLSMDEIKALIVEAVKELGYGT